ncbi:MAG: hypothetical protein Crog4KO_04760 [Crocinitomicaceae bacterium]
MRILFSLLLLWSIPVYAQDTDFNVSAPNSLMVKNNRGGIFSLGMRSTLSTFNGHHNESNGFGVGGQFRVQFADKVNSDWFFDYIQSDIGDFATRTDYHIGWSVLYYPLRNPPPKVQPYVLAGHCFDRTFMMENGNRSNNITRWSSAAQAGIGVHFNLTNRLDLSLVGQYMLHLGNEVGAHVHGDHVEFHEESGSSMEGHLLFHVGINYKIADLW